MQNISLAVNWFFGIDVIFELFFAIIALIVSVYAFKIYKLSNQKQSKLFGYAFLFFSISYFIQSFLNFIIVSKLNENISNVSKIQIIAALSNFGIYFHILFFILGLITLIYLTLKIDNKKIYSLLLIISLFFILLSSNKIYAFYILSSILLIYITAHYFSNYIKNKQIKTLLILVAFVFLMVGNVHFMFAIGHQLFYILGHFLELIAYLLILLNLFLILKNGKKKKST